MFVIKATTTAVKNNRRRDCPPLNGGVPAESGWWADSVAAITKSAAVEVVMVDRAGAVLAQTGF